MHRSGMSTPGYGVPPPPPYMTTINGDQMSGIGRASSTTSADHHHSLPNIDFQNLNISFNGCGFLGIYHIGVATALKTYVPDFRIENVSGASAGALAAVCLLGGVPTDQCAHDLMKAAADCRRLYGGPLNPKFDVCKTIHDSLAKLLPDNIHKIANGKLHISVTSVYSGENVLISNYTSKEELIGAVIASTFIPIFSGIMPTRFRGVPVIDGGFSVNQVVLDKEKTLTVSPLSGDAHICPQDHSPGDAAEIMRLYVANAGTNITWNNLLRLTQVLYPPRTKVMSDLMLAGFMDCARFLSYYGVTDKALSCLTVESHLHKSKKQVNEEANLNLPQILTNALNMFLETEEKNKPQSSADFKGQNNKAVNTMSQKLYKLIRTFVYYQPPLILTRMCYRWTVWTIQAVINSLLELLPYLTGDDTKNLKFTVEKLLGFLIGFFGPVIGYDYEKVRQTAANKKGRALGIRPQSAHPDHDDQMYNSNKAKFSCDLKIHKYEHAFDSLNAARRHFMAQDVGVGGHDGRRMSVSSDRLHHYHHYQPHSQQEYYGQSRQMSDNNLNLATDKTRRSSISPGTLESMMMTPKMRHFSSGSSASHRDFEERESAYDANFVLGEDAQSMIDIRGSDEIDPSYMDDDNSELLSMQVETYMDTNLLSVPTNAEEAIRLQTENLEAASHSKGSSRVISRRSSRRQSGNNSSFGSGLQTPSGLSTPGGRLLHTAGHSAAGTRRASMSLIGAAPMNTAAINQNMTEVEESPETLQNIMRVTRDQESVFKTYYTNEDGELVTVSLFDLTSMQDPTDLIGDDVLEPEVNLYGADFDQTLIEERLKHLHNLYGNTTGGNPDLLSSSSAIADSEGIREEDEFDLEESGSSASSGACTVEEAAYATAVGSPSSDN